MNVVSDGFKQFCRQLNTEWAITSLYHHQYRSQWVVIHREGSKDGKIVHMKHKTHLQDINNGKTEHLRADYERNLVVRGYIYRNKVS